MSDWVKMPLGLVTDVAQMLSTADSMASKTGFLLDLPRELVTGLIAYLGEDLGCDHSVNVCTCNAAEVHYALRLALAGEQICPRCHGEGMVEHPDSDNWMASCPRCHTSGVAKIEVDE